MINYAEGIYQAIVNTVADGSFVNEAVNRLVCKMQQAQRVYLIGNGGSGAACDHMANDMCLAGIRALALTNTNNITCAANDFGVEDIFQRQLAWQYTPHEDALLIALSCSGESKNIIEACEWAKPKMDVVTFSGKQPDNSLRKLGNLNFYVPSQSYGVIQIAHEALIHCAIDIHARIY